MTRGLLSAFMAIVCALILGGCDTADDAPTGDSGTDGVAPGWYDEDLLSFWLVYSDHVAAHDQGPESWEAAIEFAKANDEIYDVGAIERLRDAGFEATWSAKAADTAEGSEVQIAHLPGGPKLMLSGTIVE